MNIASQSYKKILLILGLLTVLAVAPRCANVEDKENSIFALRTPGERITAFAIGLKDSKRVEVNVASNFEVRGVAQPGDIFKITSQVGNVSFPSGSVGILSALFKTEGPNNIPITVTVLNNDKTVASRTVPLQVNVEPAPKPQETPPTKETPPAPPAPPTEIPPAPPTEIPPAPPTEIPPAPPAPPTEIPPAPPTEIPPAPPTEIPPAPPTEIPPAPPTEPPPASNPAPSQDPTLPNNEGPIDPNFAISLTPKENDNPVVMVPKEYILFADSGRADTTITITPEENYYLDESYNSFIRPPKESGLNSQTIALSTVSSNSVKSGERTTVTLLFLSEKVNTAKFRATVADKLGNVIGSKIYTLVASVKKNPNPKQSNPILSDKGINITLGERTGTQYYSYRKYNISIPENSCTQIASWASDSDLRDSLSKPVYKWLPRVFSDDKESTALIPDLKADLRSFFEEAGRIGEGCVNCGNSFSVNRANGTLEGASYVYINCRIAVANFAPMNFTALKIIDNLFDTPPQPSCEITQTMPGVAESPITVRVNTNNMPEYAYVVGSDGNVLLPNSTFQVSPQVSNGKAIYSTSAAIYTSPGNRIKECFFYTAIPLCTVKASPWKNPNYIDKPDISVNLTVYTYPTLHSYSGFISEHPEKNLPLDNQVKMYDSDLVTPGEHSLSGIVKDNVTGNISKCSSTYTMPNLPDLFVSEYSTGTTPLKNLSQMRSVFAGIGLGGLNETGARLVRTTVATKVDGIYGEHTTSNITDYVVPGYPQAGIKAATNGICPDNYAVVGIIRPDNELSPPTQLLCAPLGLQFALWSINWTTEGLWSKNSNKTDCPKGAIMTGMSSSGRKFKLQCGKLTSK